jgi:beta propeller repeat protein
VGWGRWIEASVLGFVDPVVVDSNLTNYELAAIEDSPHVLRLWSGGADGPQYFLVENRRAKGWDSFLSAFGEGVLVYHVDERMRDNSVEGDHLVSLEQADGRFDLESRRLWGFGSDAGDPFPGSTGNREFSWWTVPDNYANEGVPTQVSLRNIGDPADTVNLDLEVASPIIVFDSYVIDDKTGDRDGTPDPGEEVNVDFRLRNYGGSARDVTVHVSTEDPNVEPREAFVHVDSIGANALSEALRFSVRVGEAIPEPYEVAYSLYIEASHRYGEYRSQARFVISVPLRSLEGWPQTIPAAASSPITLADLDGDGFMEIISGGMNKRVYAWSRDGSPVPGWPVRVGGVVGGKPAVCDIDVDGAADVIVGSRDGKVYVFRSDGEQLDGWPQQTGAEILGSPVLSDIDDDGMVEVVCGSTDGKVYAWNEDGGKVPGWPVKLGGFEIWMSPAAADLDGDHVVEIVVGGYGGKLYVLQGDGECLEGWPVAVGRGCGTGSPTIADFDGDGALDIAVSGLFANSIYLVGIDGKVKDGWPRWSNNCQDLTSPVAADIDNDGLPEVAVATACGTIVAWNYDGSECRSITGRADHPVYNCEPLFADLDGNDTMEGLIGTSGTGAGEVDAFGAGGRILGFPVRLEERVAGTPAVADIDSDGALEIVAATSSGIVNAWRFVGPQEAGRIEYSQARGDIWNTGLYGFKPNANVPLADLAVSSGDVSVTPAKPRVGDTLRVDVTVTNAGHAPAGGFDVRLFCDSVSVANLVGSIRVPYLAAKDRVSLSFGWVVPGGRSTRLALVTLDPDDEVLELSELDNRAGKRFYLAVADLEVSIRRVDPFPVILDDSLAVHTVVRNKGEDAATGFELSFYDSIVAGERLFASFGVDTLMPGDSICVAPRYGVGCFRGDYLSIWASVDQDGRVLEYHRSNNICRYDVPSGISGRVLTVPLAAAISDMICSRSHVALASPQGQTILVMEAREPYRLAFETMGTDVDLCRNTVVLSTGGDIIGYDLADSVMFVVSTSPADEIQPTVWGDNVAWVSGSGDRTDLVMRRSTARPETVRTAGASEISDPDLSNELLVWEEMGDRDRDIMGYDLTGDSLIVICDEEGDQRKPSASGKVVVWEDDSSDGGDVAGVNLATGKRLDVASMAGEQVEPQVAGDLVVWQDSRNGGWDIYAYSLDEGREFPVSRQRDDQVMPSVSDSTVFWVDRRLSADGIVGLEFGGPRVVADVRRFETLSQDGQITLFLQVEEHTDDVSYRYYRYPDQRKVLDDRMAHVRHEFRLGEDSIYVYADTSVAARRPFFYTLGVIDGYGEETLYGPVGGSSYAPVPRELLLGRPFPNPCRGEVSFSVGLPREALPAGGASWPDPEDHRRAVTVGVYSVSGRLVRTLAVGTVTPGYYRFDWDGRDDRGHGVASGVYFINARAGDDALTKKVILIR